MCIHQLSGPCLLGGSAFWTEADAVGSHDAVLCKEAYCAPPAGCVSVASVEMWRGSGLGLVRPRQGVCERFHANGAILSASAQCR